MKKTLFFTVALMAASGQVSAQTQEAAASRAFANIYAAKAACSFDQETNEKADSVMNRLESVFPFVRDPQTFSFVSGMYERADASQKAQLCAATSAQIDTLNAQ